MKKLFMLFCVLSQALGAQQVADCKYRFDNYLNFRGSLNGKVKFEKDVIYIHGASGKKELAIYNDEIAALAKFFETNSFKKQEELIKKKGLKHFGQKQLDSLSTFSSQVRQVLKSADKQPLKGFRIALDPGHFATNLKEAQVEQKFLYFAPTGTSKDSVKLFESFLTYNTATILKSILEEQGATVMVTRDDANHTSFNCSYTNFMKHHKVRILDSLRNEGAISGQKYATLIKATDYNFFWDFFRDFDLANRAVKINAFNPNITLIIHYNVDEKNVPWNKHTDKNFSMAFIGGAFTSDNLDRTEGRVNFIRLLLTDQLNRSQLLAKSTVSSFNKQLDIAIAKASDATYLQNNCLTTSSPGVFCRNLALCRKINSPLVYGESLYQDNVKESAMLMRSDLDLYGIKSNERLKKVALSYYEGLSEFLKLEASK